MSHASIHPVELSDGTIHLREFVDDDLDRIHALVGDPAVTRTLSFDTRSRAQAASMLAGARERAQRDPRTEYYLAICRSSDDLLVGFVRLGLAGVDAGKLGCAVHREHWGVGYATRASQLMIEFGFRRLGLRRISAAVGPDNASSLVTVDRLGFTYEGRLRDHVFTDGRWRDSLLYSILEPEWTSRSNSTGLAHPDGSS